MEDQQSTNRAKANTLSIAGWLVMFVGALTAIIAWFAPATFPKAVHLAYVLMVVAFFLKQSETVALRRVMGVDIDPTADHDQQPKS